MSEQNEKKPGKPLDSDSGHKNANSPFKLEKIYSDVSLIFKSSKVDSSSSPAVLVAIDTNVLLLPYTIRKDGLPKLQQFYNKLRSEGRLFLPARAAREFINLRDKKLAELLKTIGDVKSRINIGETKLSPILEGIEGSDQLSTASKALSDAKEQYTKAISILEEKVSSWSGNDPVTNVYATVFDLENIISPLQSEEEILSEWETRQKDQMPPGYKDSSKPDTGIGDFLIWKSLLYLGEQKKKDLIFVTGEEKADWFVRSNGGAAYPRPELIAEYRKHSGGKNIRLVSFHDVLREMEAPKELVSEVELAENAANTIVRFDSSVIFGNATHPTSNANDRSEATSKYTHFLLPYGGEDIVFASSNGMFRFNISEQGKNSIWIYPNPRIILSRLNTGNIGEPIDLNSPEQMVDSFPLRKGEIIIARNTIGNVLIARLVSANQPDVGQTFEVTFANSTYKSNEQIFIP